MVGTARFELTTSCSQSRRSTRLSYVPLRGGEIDTSRATAQDYFSLDEFFLKTLNHKLLLSPLCSKLSASKTHL